MMMMMILIGNNRSKGVTKDNRTRLLLSTTTTFSPIDLIADQLIRSWAHVAFMDGHFQEKNSPCTRKLR